MKKEINRLKLIKTQAVVAFVEKKNKFFKRKNLPQIELIIRSQYEDLDPTPLGQRVYNEAVAFSDYTKTFRPGRRDVIGDPEIRDDGYWDYYEFCDITVSAPDLKFDGWTFCASVTDIGADQNLLSVAEGVELPDRFRNTDHNKCEHCNKSRNRKETFIVGNESGEFKQVGRSCLKDFLGHHIDGKISALTEWFHVISQIEEQEVDDEWAAGYKANQWVWDLDNYLRAVIQVSQHFGFCSKTAAANSDGAKEASVYKVGQVMCRKARGKEWEEILNLTNEELQKLESDLAELKAWGASLEPSNNDFENNLWVLGI